MVQNVCWELLHGSISFQDLSLIQTLLQLNCCHCIDAQLSRTANCFNFVYVRLGTELVSTIYQDQLHHLLGHIAQIYFASDKSPVFSEIHVGPRNKESSNSSTPENILRLRRLLLNSVFHAVLLCSRRIKSLKPHSPVFSLYSRNYCRSLVMLETGFIGPAGVPVIYPGTL